MSNKNIDIDIDADPSGYRRGADEAKKITRDLTQEFSTANKTLSALSGIAATVGKGLAIGAAVGGAAAIGMTKNIISTADAMNDLSKKTGLSVTDLGAWKLATVQSGTNLEGLADGLKHVAKYMVEHDDNLKKIGITSKTSEGVLVQLAGVLSRMDDNDPRKMALANEVLGKSYQGLMPLLSEGEEGLRKLLERGRELNPVTKQLAAESDLFNDQLEELKLSAGGLGSSLATTLLPHLNDILASMRAAARESGLLSAVWAGMVGLTKHALGLDDVSQARDRLAEVKQELIEINNFLSGDKASALHTQAMIPRLKALGIEKAQLEALLNPAAAETATRNAPSDAVLKDILNPDKSRRKTSTGKAAKVDNSYLEEIKGLSDLMQEIGKLSVAEKSHIQVLQDKLTVYKDLDPAVKEYLQISIDQASQTERLKLFETESKKLLAENQNLNVGLIESDRERVVAQLELEHQRSIERINGLKLESDQVQALIEQETKNYELRMKQAQQGTEKTSDLVKSLGLQFTSAFENAIVGGQKFSGVLLGLERDIERMLARQLVTKPLLGGLEQLMNGFIGSFFGSLGGGGGKAAISGGGLTGFAANGAWFEGATSYFSNGGIFDSPTAFRFGNGGRLGVMGEAGPEAILPLKRGANGQLGVQGGGGGGVNVQINLIESPGNGGQVQQRQDSDGTLTLDIMVEQIEGKMGRNISRGNGLAPMLESRYALNPAAGAMR